jgi:hypothetical protein
MMCETRKGCAASQKSSRAMEPEFNTASFAAAWIGKHLRSCIGSSTRNWIPLMTYSLCPSARAARQKYRGIPRVINPSGSTLSPHFGLRDHGSQSGELTHQRNLSQGDSQQCVAHRFAVDLMLESSVFLRSWQRDSVLFRLAMNRRRREFETLETAVANIQLFLELCSPRCVLR